MAKRPDLGRIGEMLQARDLLLAFTYWLEDEGYTMKKGGKSVLGEKVVWEYVCDNKSERDALSELLERYEDSSGA